MTIMAPPSLRVHVSGSLPWGSRVDRRDEFLDETLDHPELMAANRLPTHLSQRCRICHAEDHDSTDQSQRAQSDAVRSRIFPEKNRDQISDDVERRSHDFLINTREGFRRLH